MKKQIALLLTTTLLSFTAVNEMRASGSVDRDAMMAKRKEQSDARDLKLKAIFTEDQMKKWKDEIEPTTRQQRAPSNN